MQVTAIDLEPRAHSEFPVIKADSKEYAFEKDSIVVLCRPCHENGFVRDTVLQALTSGVRNVIYIGLQRNVRADLGGYFSQFTKHRITGIGHADERIWELKVSRLQANANLRRGRFLRCELVGQDAPYQVINGQTDPTLIELLKILTPLPRQERLDIPDSKSG